MYSEISLSIHVSKLLWKYDVNSRENPGAMMSKDYIHLCSFFTYIVPCWLVDVCRNMLQDLETLRVPQQTIRRCYVLDWRLLTYRITPLCCHDVLFRNATQQSSHVKQTVL